MLFIGGGIKGGMVYGKTADESPCQPIEKVVGLSDIFATLGIPPDDAIHVEKRPYRVTQEGEGRLFKELFT